MKIRKRIFYILVILGFLLTEYLAGLMNQIFLSLGNLQEMMAGEAWIDANPFVCFGYAFSLTGLIFGMIYLIAVGIFTLYARASGKFDSKEKDDRGFKTLDNGIYGTAKLMDLDELKQTLELQPIPTADGVILGKWDNKSEKTNFDLTGKVICMPKDTRLNRNIAVFGASGTGKSRCVIRPAIFTSLLRKESIVITDPKGEMYADTSELCRKYGYEVKVLNFLNPKKSDCWPCMHGVSGEALPAQVMVNSIIKNTSEGSENHFWDNSEENLLKALIMRLTGDKTMREEDVSLGTVYRFLTLGEDQFGALFTGMNDDEPAKMAYNIYANDSDTVRKNVVSGLSNRLQILQDKSVCNMLGGTIETGIDLTAPAKKKCAYYVILSDQDSTMTFLSSLFFTFLFRELVAYADSTPEQRCPVPVNLLLDEFNNIGKLGAASDGSDFAKTLSTIRSRDIRCTLVCQSLGQLQNRYPLNLWSEIIGNCDIKLMLGCTDEITAEFFSNRSGVMSVEVQSTMTDRKTITPVQLIPDYRRVQGTGKRMLFNPDEILRLPNRNILIDVRGHNLLLAEKFDYTEHPMSKELVRTSIQNYSSPQDLDISGSLRLDKEKTPKSSSSSYSRSYQPQNTSKPKKRKETDAKKQITLANIEQIKGNREKENLESSLNRQNQPVSAQNAQPLSEMAETYNRQNTDSQAQTTYDPSDTSLDNQLQNFLNDIG